MMMRARPGDATGSGPIGRGRCSCGGSLVAHGLLLGGLVVVGSDPAIRRVALRHAEANLHALLEIPCPGLQVG